MQTVTLKLTGLGGSASPLFFGKPVFEKKGTNETHEQHEERTWKLKVGQTDSGQVYLQPFALKNALESAASRIGMKVPGQRMATFTKLFRQGILVVDQMLLFNPTTGKPVTIAEITPLRLFVPSDGKRGSGKRVERIFPELRGWTTEATIHLVDPKITEDVLRTHAEEAGKFIGFGSMRVENGGINGRFEVA